jgi:hypothetical protein
MSTAVLQITPELLADFLGLPAETVIEPNACGPTGYPIVEVRVSHPDIPAETTVVHPEYRRDGSTDRAVFVAWNPRRG